MVMKEGVKGFQLHGTSLLSYSLGGVVFELHRRESGVQLSYCTMKEKLHTFPVG